ncbi:prenyltransferase/squalene oxidase repeat-containing protein [Blastopirellula retiformator]|uniref:Prenyltransferase and squalene oxidase repeat protein n=1 Tax=Blastopirellula retiformator TaxID=2527970 RepID=A0A5C5V8Z7_9BACT|nr:hypothetical protein [Blastopirellula retiformator]TWT34327.1 hypothetical protein Enr8_17210 [Blastopirellula retiformator]
MTGKTSPYVVLFVCLFYGTGISAVSLESEVWADQPPAENPARTDIETKKTIDRGLTWLVSTIHKDGTVGPDVYHESNLACTAMVGLALMTEGSTAYGGRYSKESRRVLGGVLDLVERRKLDGGESKAETLVQHKIGANADVFLATLYLSEVYYEAPGYEKDIEEALNRLIRHICQSQRADGMWGDESWAPILGTVLGWESLRSAHSAGFKINASSRLVAEALIKRLRDKSKDKGGWMHTFYKNASSLRVLYSMDYRDDPLFAQSVEDLLALTKERSPTFELAGGEEFLSYYLVTQCMLKEPDNAEWAQWHPHVRKALIRLQNGDGSWTGHHCIRDRTFCTAAALMTLLSTNYHLSVSDL